MARIRRLLRRSIAQVIAIAVGLVFLFPLLAIFNVSTQGEGLLENYGAVLTETSFFRFSFNSLVIAVGTIALTYAATMTAAYAFAKLKLPGKDILFFAILAGLVLPSATLIVPLFIAVRELDLFNNYLAVIVPLAALSIPFLLLIARNFIEGIPDEILDAAKIDGCGSFRTLVVIVLPLSAPITVVLVVLVYLWSWNEFLLPLLFFQDPNMQVVTQVPLAFTSQYASDTPKIFAALVLISLPVVAIYIALQRAFESGLTSGSLK